MRGAVPSWDRTPAAPKGKVLTGIFFLHRPCARALPLGNHLKSLMYDAVLDQQGRRYVRCVDALIKAQIPHRIKGLLAADPAGISK